ncbi:hypothetical protein PIGHUM_03355 [Pigmentiphaga humi]|uniref:Uncharacterized protein n=1 Tax=Pigmentiphaga humi TaxID=2478468 RepID=A0A3P4B4Q6_9BURK|nr:hypothetical protein [Pigmentiphaga humi]VCU71274.1 hypothetical protein PIGHUM_03355 [Pigmentiphaga humi]
MHPPEWFAIRSRHGVPEFPVHHVRGGTSTGLIVWDALAPSDPPLKEELLRLLLGTPKRRSAPGERPYTVPEHGLSAGNQVFFADVEPGPDGARLIAKLARVPRDTGDIEWGAEWGRLPAALPLWALDMGLAPPGHTGAWSIAICNADTGLLATGRIWCRPAGALTGAAMPGVDGEFPLVELVLPEPGGAGATHRCNAQILMSGYVPLYQASPALRAWFGG